MTTSRKLVANLSLLLSLISLLFYQFAGLYFFLDGSAEPYPVDKLKSSGNDEDALIIWGFVLFLVLAIFNFLRRKSPFAMLDLGALFFVLVIQGLFLCMIEVATFEHSLQAHNGWILFAWLSAYCSLWLALVAIIVFKIRRETGREIWIF